MIVEELEAKIKALEDKIQTLEDIEEIKKLQRAYGYYLENWMTDEVADLFSDSPDVVVRVRAGVFYGKEGVIRFFRHGKADVELKVQDDPKFFHQVMQLSPVVHIDPDGKTAKGRWYGFGANAFPVDDRISQGWMNGIYENEYVKENGKWKILKLYWYMTFHASHRNGWIDPSKEVIVPDNPDFSALKPDAPSENSVYPSGFIAPFHFKNPVTDK